MKFSKHDDTFKKENLHKLTDNQLCENLDGIMAK